MPAPAASLPKGKRIVGPDRERATKRIVAAYKKKQSIREIAEAEGRSYGFVHRVLVEADTPLRGRGGPTRAKAK